jgi:hypothetical protein
MTEGIRRVEQPPWYVGYQNTIEPADNSYLSAAARYGYRGSKNIKQYQTQPIEHPEKTRTPYTPKFLTGGKELENEWVPPIHAKPLNQGYVLTSPKLWPENTRYVTGFKKKELPTSIFYNRETTAAVKSPPEIPPSLTSLVERSTAENNDLLDFSKMESSKTLLSNTMVAQMKLDTSWKTKLAESASPSLKVSMRTQVCYDIIHFSIFFFFFFFTMAQ